MLTKKIKNKKGFTLIELIVVIAVIAILAAVLIPRFAGFTEDANSSGAISDARNVLVCLESLDAQNDFPDDAAAALIAVNKYIGKDLITTDTLTGIADEDIALTGPDSDEDGVDFVLTKVIGSKTYTVTVTDSKLPAAASVV